MPRKRFQTEESIQKLRVPNSVLSTSTPARTVFHGTSSGDTTAERTTSRDFNSEHTA